MITIVNKYIFPSKILFITKIGLKYRIAKQVSALPSFLTLDSPYFKPYKGCICLTTEKEANLHNELTS